MSTMHRLTRTTLRSSSLLIGLFLGAAAFVVAPPAAAHASTASSSTLEVTITADKKGTVNLNTGEITVSGTIVCSRPANAFVTSIVTQANGSHDAAGGFGYNLDCSPTPVAFEATITPFSGDHFKPGRADFVAAAYVYDYDQETTVSATDSRVITLKGF